MPCLHRVFEKSHEVTETDRTILHPYGVWRGCHQMHMYLREPMRGHWDAFGSSQSGYLAPFCDAPTRHGIRLEDGSCPVVDDLLEAPARSLYLPAGHRYANCGGYRSE